MTAHFSGQYFCLTSIKYWVLIGEETKHEPQFMTSETGPIQTNLLDLGRNMVGSVRRRIGWVGRMVALGVRAVEWMGRVVAWAGGVVGQMWRPVRCVRRVVGWVGKVVGNVRRVVE